VKTAAWREGTSNGGGCSSRARKSLRWCPLDPRFLSYTS
jgi:hypothetical protein